MKAPKSVVLILSLLLLTFWGTAPAHASPQAGVLQEQRDNRIRARAADYQARLDALYAEKVAAWSTSFLQRRQEAIRRAGKILATEAAAVRTARRVSWEEVGRDPRFVAAQKEQILLILEPKQIRQELTVWAREVEAQTRSEMIEFFRQVIAEDLGMIFDQRLRGRVVQAVQAIPLETLVAGNTAQIEARIRSALPASALTTQQRNGISAAASALAYAAGPALAIAAGVPTLGREVGILAGLLTQFLTARGLDALDRAITGEPSPDALARQMTLAVQDWQKRNLESRLQEILERFGQQVMDTLEDQARAANLGRATQ